jgi:hypothetical protein
MNVSLDFRFCNMRASSVPELAYDSRNDAEDTHSRRIKFLMKWLRWRAAADGLAMKAVKPGRRKKRSLRPKQHRLPLEHLHGKVKCPSRVYARRSKDQHNIVPVIFAGNKFLAQQTDV